ncbi:hypothetical protein C8R47DRAFT_1330174 [Mycena vitilis]|nr:hypothetical protein C8R47DRAFT_1330174 [Mycena vitilis]
MFFAIQITVPIYFRPVLAGSKRPPTEDCITFLTIEGYLQRCAKLELNISITTEQLLHIFRHAFVLVEAKFSDVHPSWHPRTSFIEVENLRVLDITTQVAIVEPLFNCVVLPQLCDLHISAANPHPDLWTAITSLLTRSQCRIETLAYVSTEQSTIPTTPIAEFLQHPRFEHLQHLVLRGVLVDPHAIEVLTVDFFSEATYAHAHGTGPGEMLQPRWQICGHGRLAVRRKHCTQ